MLEHFERQVESINWVDQQLQQREVINVHWLQRDMLVGSGDVGIALSNVPIYKRLE